MLLTYLQIAEAQKSKFKKIAIMLGKCGVARALRKLHLGYCRYMGDFC